MIGAFFIGLRVSFRVNDSDERKKKKTEGLD